MQPSKSFKTKTGSFYILSDRISLIQTGFSGKATKLLMGEGIFRPFLYYLFIAALVLYNSYKFFSAGKYGVALLLIIISFWLIYVVIDAIRNPVLFEVNRASIQTIVLKPAKTGTNAYIEVFFIRNDNLKKYSFKLPNALHNGQDETARIVEILTAENLLPS